LKTSTISLRIGHFNCRTQGRSLIDTWSLREQLVSGAARYSQWLVADPHLTMQRIWELADPFPFWQRRKHIGRPAIKERDLQVTFLVRQLFNATFRQLQALLGCSGSTSVLIRYLITMC